MGCFITSYVSRGGIFHAVYDEIQPKVATATTLTPNPAYEIRFPCKIKVEENCAYAPTVSLPDESAVSQGIYMA